MRDLYETIYRRKIEEGYTRDYAKGFAEGYVEGFAEGFMRGTVKYIFTCMRTNGCDVKGALALIGYDHSEWPSLIEAANAIQERARAAAEQDAAQATD